MNAIGPNLGNWEDEIVILDQGGIRNILLTIGNRIRADIAVVKTVTSSGSVKLKNRRVKLSL